MSNLGLGMAKKFAFFYVKNYELDNWHNFYGVAKLSEHLVLLLSGMSLEDYCKKRDSVGWWQ